MDKLLRKQSKTSKSKYMKAYNLRNIVSIELFYSSEVYENTIPSESMPRVEVRFDRIVNEDSDLIVKMFLDDFEAENYYIDLLNKLSFIEL